MDQSGQRQASAAGEPSNTPTAVTNILELLTAAGNLKTFAAAARIADLTEALSHKGRFTVFVPTDEAFLKLSARGFDALLKDPARLKAVLNYHTVSGHLLTEDLKSGEMTTLQGLTLTATVSGADVRVNDARVVQPNMVATNGVVHTIESIILPKYWRLAAAAA